MKTSSGFASTPLASPAPRIPIAHVLDTCQSIGAYQISPPRPAQRFKRVLLLVCSPYSSHYAAFPRRRLRLIQSRPCHACPRSVSSLTQCHTPSPERPFRACRVCALWAKRPLFESTLNVASIQLLPPFVHPLPRFSHPPAWLHATFTMQIRSWARYPGGQWECGGFGISCDGQGQRGVHT